MPEEPGLLRKTVRGAQWIFFARFIVRAFQAIRTIFLAAILLPLDFDIVAAAFIVVNFLDTFSATGYDAALIRKKEGVGDYLDAAWTIMAVRGALLAIILAIFAHPIALFFDREFVEIILYVFSASLFIRGLTNIGIVHFDRDMQFHKKFLFLSGGAIADIMVAIGAALIMKNVWALVFGAVARDLAQCVLSYVLHPYRPRFKFNFKQIRELSHFGKWILMDNILFYLIGNVDQIFVAKWLRQPFLGFYSMAYHVTLEVIGEIAGVCVDVLYPAYVKIQSDIDRLRANYLDSLLFVVTIIAPMVGGLFVLANDFVVVVLGGKWLPMVPAMVILCFWSMERVLVITTTVMLRAIDRPDISPKVNLVRLAGLAGSIYPLTIVLGWGIAGVAAAVVAGTVLAAPLHYSWVCRILKIRFSSLLGATILPLVCSAAMAAIISLSKTYLIVESGVIPFILLILIGVAAYCLTLFPIDALFGGRVRSLLSRILRQVRAK